ncbi:DUF192 domain-containing protein [Candidatus Uhrbacteria bacterium]|nr:DUF192 domain-containing protein [Candidatus Uhrbacteria bacterium]
MKPVWCPVLGLATMVLSVSLVMVVFHPFRSVTVLPLAEVRIGQSEVTVEVADEAPERFLGLSGRQSLSAGQGMIFVFDRPDRYGFWMRDMNFPLDFVWIDGGRILEITPGVFPPENGTEPFPFYPQRPVSVVLEVPGGYAQSQGWKPGQAVEVSWP